MMKNRTCCKYLMLYFSEMKGANAATYKKSKSHSYRTFDLRKENICLTMGKSFRNKNYTLPGVCYTRYESYRLTIGAEWRLIKYTSIAGAVRDLW